MDDRARKSVKVADPLDFDGHTEFSRWKPDECLSWLDEANAAYLELHGREKRDLRVAEGPSETKHTAE